MTTKGGGRRPLLVPVAGTLGGVLIAVVLFSLTYSTRPGIFFHNVFSDESFRLVFTQIRLPRTIIAFLVGGALAMCGVTLQSILRNPLAEPYTLGISGGASLGVAVAVVTGLADYFGPYGNPLLGFAGALVSMAIVYGLSKRRFFDPSTMILFGIVTNLVFSSFVFLFISLMDPDRVQGTLMWLMGDLSTLEPSVVMWYVPLLLIPSVLLGVFGKDLDLLSLGSEKAQYLGANPPRLYKVLFIVTSLLTALCVSASVVLKNIDYFVFFGDFQMEVLTYNALLFFGASPVGKTRYMFGKDIPIEGKEEAAKLYVVKPKELFGRGYYALWINDTAWDFLIE